MRPAGVPGFDLGCLMGGVIVYDDMDIEPFWDLSVDFLEKLQELDYPVALVAFSGHKRRCDVERGKQRGCTIPHIAVRTTHQNTLRHRQDRLLAIERA